jgi:hypothetical protein
MSDGAINAIVLERVKAAMNITGDYQDAALTEFIVEVKAYLMDAGVADNVLESDVACGLIVRGVIDLWNYGAGDARLSNYFIQRTIQLASGDANENV